MTTERNELFTTERTDNAIANITRRLERIMVEYLNKLVKCYILKFTVVQVRETMIKLATCAERIQTALLYVDINYNNNNNNGNK